MINLCNDCKEHDKCFYEYHNLVCKKILDYENSLKGKQYIINHSESAMHCKIAGKKVSIQVISPNKAVVLNNLEFKNGYYLWDWGYTLFEDSISLH